MGHISFLFSDHGKTCSFCNISCIFELLAHFYDMEKVMRLVVMMNASFVGLTGDFAGSCFPKERWGGSVRPMRRRGGCGFTLTIFTYLQTHYIQMFFLVIFTQARKLTDTPLKISGTKKVGNKMQTSSKHKQMSQSVKVPSEPAHRRTDIHAYIARQPAGAGTGSRGQNSLGRT